MLKLLIPLFFVLNFNAMANVAFEVKGKLKLFTLPESSSLILRSDEGDLRIENKNYYTYGCKKGEFLVVSNYHPEGTYSIVEILSCEEFAKDSHEGICPKNLNLVCGSPVEYKCENFYCDEVELGPQTFSNRCDLLKNGARFLYEGPCRP